jgi:hypothetical protein
VNKFRDKYANKKKKTSPSLEGASVRNKHSMYKPPDSALALWGVLLGIAGAVIYFLQLGAMRTQLDLMDKEFTMSHRPWVTMAGLAAVVKPLTFDSEDAHVDITLPLKNGGSSPALNVHTNLSLIISGNNTMFSDANYVIDHECSASYVEQMLKMKLGTPLLLPGDTINTLEGNHPLMYRNSFRLDPTDRRIEAWVVFSISYEDDLGRPHCSSIAQAYRADDERGFYFEPNGSVQGHLTPTGLGKAY